MKSLDLYHIISERVSCSNYIAFIYGSAAYDLSLGRDIDLMAISADFHYTEVLSFQIEINGFIRSCNFYMIAEKMFLDDVYGLAYGGYYSYKLSVMFNEILRVGEALDAGRLFWSIETLRSRTPNVDNKARSIIKETHRRIFNQMPTFISPLTNYLENTVIASKLENFVESIVISQIDAFLEHVRSTRHSEYAENSSKAFYLYWREYAKYKDNNVLWGERSIDKIKRCLIKGNHIMVSEYIYK